jgi:SAM-dependent methyltransferase
MATQKPRSTGAVLGSNMMTTIQKQAEALNPWFYAVDLGGYTTVPGVFPTGQKDRDTQQLLNRQRCRQTLLVDAVAERYDFAGKTLLDVACNCGYWSSLYLRNHGAASLLGIEGRDVFLQQAQLYYFRWWMSEHGDLATSAPAEFAQANVVEFDYEAMDRVFDFILCAGILYHIPDQHALLTKLAAVNTEVMVIDTRVDPNDRKQLEPRDRSFNAIEATKMKSTPSVETLSKILDDLGYDFEILPPKFKTVPGVNGCDDYNAGRRVCIFARKR